MATWTNQSKNAGGSNIIWNDANFSWDQSFPETWDNNFIPFINLSKNTSAWSNSTKDTSAFTNQTKN